MLNLYLDQIQSGRCLVRRNQGRQGRGTQNQEGTGRRAFTGEGCLGSDLHLRYYIKLVSVIIASASG